MNAESIINAAEIFSEIAGEEISNFESQMKMEMNLPEIATTAGLMTVAMMRVINLLGLKHGEEVITFSLHKAIENMRAAGYETEDQNGDQEGPSTLAQ